MHQQSSSVSHFVKTAALVELGVVLGTALVCWLGGWRTLSEYGTGLTIAGAVVFCSGWSFLMGTAKSYRNRSRSATAAFVESNTLFRITTAVGAVSAALGGLIHLATQLH